MICTRIFHKFPSHPSQLFHTLIPLFLQIIISCNHQYFLGMSASVRPFISMRLRSSVMPFSMRRMLRLTQQYPAKGAATTTPKRKLRNHRQYLIGIAIIILYIPTARCLPYRKANRRYTPFIKTIDFSHLFRVWGRMSSIMVIIFAYFQGLTIMRNNFPPNFPFQKKEPQNTGKTAPAFLTPHGHSPSDHSQKKIGVQRDGRWPQGEGGVSAKQIQTTEEESIASDQVSSCTSSQITTKPSKIQQKTHRQPRPNSPLRYQPRSPLSPRQAPSPPIRESRLPGPPFSPVRATLKNLLQAKASPDGKHEQAFLGHPNHSNKDIKLSGSIRSNKTFAQAFHSPVKSLQKQNQILREENELLRRELSDIKNMMAVGSSKKDDMISNLRNTIKKEDGEIKELKVKLEIFTKKNTALATLIENKDEEIAFLNKKLADMEAELNEQKERNAERFEKLKERIHLTLRSYGELQGKWNKAEIDWLNFKEKWMEEKGIYLHRIAFLEDYIANN